MRRAGERGCRCSTSVAASSARAPSISSGTGASSRSRCPTAITSRQARRVPDHNPLNPKYRLFIAAWRRLPLPVAKCIGPPSFAGSASAMSDLLFLAHRMPYPPDKGDKIRAWTFSCACRAPPRASRCFVDDPRDWPHLAHWSQPDACRLCLLPAEAAHAAAQCAAAAAPRQATLARLLP